MVFFSYTMSVARPEELLVNKLPLRLLTHYLHLTIKRDENILADLCLLDIAVKGKPGRSMYSVHSALVRPIPCL